jgi:hypothetical protein
VEALEGSRVGRLGKFSAAGEGRQDIQFQQLHAAYPYIETSALLPCDPDRHPGWFSEDQISLTI